MTEAFNLYCLFLSAIFTFLLYTSEEKFVDSFIQNISTNKWNKVNKWYTKSLLLYCQSDIDTNCRYLRLSLIPLIILMALFSHLNITLLDDYFIVLITLNFYLL